MVMCDAENWYRFTPGRPHLRCIMPDYRNLRAWQLARDVAVQSRPWIKKLPPEERDALADQWRRASYSVALNIAEGASRRGPREFRRHLDITRGSLHEIAVVLDLVVALGYLKESDLVPLRRVRDECARPVWGGGLPAPCLRESTLRHSTATTRGAPRG